MASWTIDRWKTGLDENSILPCGYRSKPHPWWVAYRCFDRACCIFIQSLFRRSDQILPAIALALLLIMFLMRM